MLRFALPKGRLGDRSYALLKNLGYGMEALEENSRRLIFTDEERGFQFLLVKPSDVGVYVERGAADIGIVGKDVLLEADFQVLEMIDLEIGKCDFAVAAPVGYQEDYYRTLRVATKYMNVARSYYGALNRDIDLIHLNGSVELAPLVGLADVIVDIVETGQTLKENNLVVVDRFMSISARLIVNETSYRFKDKAIDDLCLRLKESINENNTR